MELKYRDIGIRIKKLREARNLTQFDLATRTGLSMQHLSNIERNHTKLSLESVVKIANALGVTTDLILCDSVYRSKETLKDDLAEIVSDTTENELRAIIKVSESMLAALRSGFKEKLPWE